MSKKNKKHHHEEHIDESWLIPYADLMTLLLALFIVLYAISAVDAQKFNDMSRAFNAALTGGTGLLDNPAAIATGPSRSKPTTKDKSEKELTPEEQQRMNAMLKEEENMEKTKEQLDKYIKTNNLDSQLATKLNHSQLMITISDTALFASGSANVKPESRNLGVMISNMLEQFPDYQVIISGHTDNQPINTSQFESNWELSSARASKFMKVLLQNTDLNPKMFSVIGNGEYHPIASNNTDAGRAKNRRVEVSIMRKFVDPNNAQKISPSGTPVTGTTTTNP